MLNGFEIPQDSLNWRHIYISHPFIMVKKSRVFFKINCINWFLFANHKKEGHTVKPAHFEDLPN